MKTEDLVKEAYQEGYKHGFIDGLKMITKFSTDMVKEAENDLLEESTDDCERREQENK